MLDVVAVVDVTHGSDNDDDRGQQVLIVLIISHSSYKTTKWALKFYILPKLGLTRVYSKEN